MHRDKVISMVVEAFCNAKLVQESAFRMMEYCNAQLGFDSEKLGACEKEITDVLESKDKPANVDDSLKDAARFAAYIGLMNSDMLRGAKALTKTVQKISAEAV